MKNLFSFLLLFITISAKAEQNVGTYYNSYFKKNYDIEASEKNGMLKTVFVGVEAKDSKNAFIAVDGKDLEAFKHSLELVKNKYLEWRRIAEENHVSEMKKSFGIIFPSVEVYWLGSKWWSSYKLKVDLKFQILDDGKIVAVWVPTANHWDNKYIDETIYFVFSDVDDFNNLISQLNYQEILKKLLQTKNNEDLFQ